MAQLVTVIEQTGPLPSKAIATIESDGPTIVTIAGSVWSPKPDQMIGVELSIDGAPAQNARIFSNPASTHLAVVPVSFSYTFPWTENQQHTFELDYLPGTDTTSDGNDRFIVTVEY
jgi:hypothetical protein